MFEAGRCVNGARSADLFQPGGHMAWGLLGPETIPNQRRTRTLGLGAAVRTFNDLSVPGLGGAWFGKQLFLATIGIATAEALRRVGRRCQNIEVANGVEALGCWLALKSNGWTSDSRLRGALKMHGKSDLTFAMVRKPSFYVTQPMRMATVQPLRVLGLTAGSVERFNAFACSTMGRDFVEAVCADFNPCYYKKSVSEYLTFWAVSGSEVSDSPNLRQALSPLHPMAKHARAFLRDRLIQGADKDSVRRRSALKWVNDLRTGSPRVITWDRKPSCIEEDHWRDIRVGATFFLVRDAAIALLNTVEGHIGHLGVRLPLDKPLPARIREAIDVVRQRAQAFDTAHDSSAGKLATAFCQECADPDNARLLEKLVTRDDRVLRLRDRTIIPGAAFRGASDDGLDMARSADEEGAEVKASEGIPWPDGISHRIRNLFLMNLDLEGVLGDWLNRDTAMANAAQ